MSVAILGNRASSAGKAQANPQDKELGDLGVGFAEERHHR